MKFALALGAHNQRGQYGYTAGFTSRARSKAEAVGIGVEMCKAEFPLSEGWASHGCVAVQIPDKERVSVRGKKRK